MPQRAVNPLSARVPCPRLCYSSWIERRILQSSMELVFRIIPWSFNLIKTPNRIRLRRENDVHTMSSGSRQSWYSVTESLISMIWFTVRTSVYLLLVRSWVDTLGLGMPIYSWPDCLQTIVGESTLDTCFISGWWTWLSFFSVEISRPSLWHQINI